MTKHLSIFLSIFLFLLQFINSSYVKAAEDNLGLYGITLSSTPEEVIDKFFIKDDFNIYIYGNCFDLQSEYMERLFSLLPDDINIKSNIKNINELNEYVYQFYTSSHGIFFEPINKGIDTLKTRDFEYLIDINNKYGIYLIPMFINSHKYKIGILFFSTNKEDFKPLYFKVSFSSIEEVNAAKDILNKRFNNNEVNSNNEYILEKDNTTVFYERRTGSFIFYSVAEVDKFLKKFNEISNLINKELTKEKEIKEQNKVNELQKDM